MNLQGVIFLKGITFGNYHSYDDFRLILGSQEIGSPDIKENKIKIEGADGDLDFTDFFGSPKYENVRHKFNFSTIVPQAEFLSLFSTVKNAIHGKKLRIILDDDPLFYYIGRCFVSKFTNEKGIGIVSVECDCEPYKYKIEKTRHIANLSGKNLLDIDNLVPVITSAVTLNKFGTGVRVTSQLDSGYMYVALKILPTSMAIGRKISARCNSVASSTNRPLFALGYATAPTYRVQTSAVTGAVSMAVSAEMAETYQYVVLFLYGQAVGTGVAGDYVDYNDLQVEIGGASEYEPYDNKEKTISIFLENLKTPAVPTIISQHEVTITNGEETLIAREEEPLISPEFQLSEGINQFNITGIGLVAFEWQEGGL